MTLAAFQGETLGYGGAAVLRGVTLTLDRGERLVLLGRSGAGKTTLLNALYDRLTELARDLARGADGTKKPLSLTPSLLRRIATDRPGDLSRYLDAPRLDRFGAAFAAEIEKAQGTAW